MKEHFGVLGFLLEQSNIDDPFLENRLSLVELVEIPTLDAPPSSVPN